MSFKEEKIPVIAVVGPTASGKTALGVEIAKIYNGEVISADSMQIYNGMDIATAKPSAEERQDIPHHLMSFLELDSVFSVADYVKLAGERINDIYSRGKMPVVVGGTGLYISSLLENIQFADIASDPILRKELADEALNYGNEALFCRLMKVDPETAQTLHKNNMVRVIRALEVYELTGKKLSEYKTESRLQESPYKPVMIGLNYNDRQKLYDKINQRVDIMIKSGLIDEANEVYKSGHLKTASNAIGYKELLPYFNGSADIDECIEKIKRETRRYAKRQLTWFRKNAEIIWVMLDEFDNPKKILEKCEKIIAKGISL